jgi:hypothetical protein
MVPFKKMKSFSETLPSIPKKLVLVSLILSIIFTALVTYRMVFSDFRLE